MNPINLNLNRTCERLSPVMRGYRMSNVDWARGCRLAFFTTSVATVHSLADPAMKVGSDVKQDKSFDDIRVHDECKYEPYP